MKRIAIRLLAFNLLLVFLPVAGVLYLGAYEGFYCVGCEGFKTDKELEGLVYSLTPRVQGQGGAWYTRPTWVGGLVLAATLALNLLFR